MVKKIISVLLLLTLLCSVFSCKEEELKIRVGELVLTFPEGFSEKTPPKSSNKLLSNGEMTVTVTRVSFYDAEAQGIPSAYGAEDFAQYMLNESGREGDVYFYGDMPYYSYYYTDESGAELFCMATFYKTPYAFFTVLFATYRQKEHSARELIFDISDTAVFELS